MREKFGKHILRVGLRLLVKILDRQTDRQTDRQSLLLAHLET